MDIHKYVLIIQLFCTVELFFFNDFVCSTRYFNDFNNCITSIEKFISVKIINI